MNYETFLCNHKHYIWSYWCTWHAPSLRHNNFTEKRILLVKWDTNTVSRWFLRWTYRQVCCTYNVQQHWYPTHYWRGTLLKNGTLFCEYRHLAYTKSRLYCGARVWMCFCNNTSQRQKFYHASLEHNFHFTFHKSCK